MHEIPVWKQAPFIRILPAFICGIVFQEYAGCNLFFIYCSLGITFLVFCILQFGRLSFHFTYAWLTGICLFAILFNAGALLTNKNNKEGEAVKSELLYKSHAVTLLHIKEPLAARASSYKTVAEVESVQEGQNIFSQASDILVYLRKDGLVKVPAYGDRIIIFKQPVRIRNFDSTGRFDYIRYCALQNIYFQVFLNYNDFTIINEHQVNPVLSLLYRTRDLVVRHFQKNIPGKKESGFAEALLIGYKDDLDRNLISSYSNTGVVHVVAISGLHLALIYALLRWICIPLTRKMALAWLAPVITIGGLWMFSLLAGGTPSVLRSAVMFSCIVLGKNMRRQSSILNNLAGSAFLLLWYDPFWLWDIGFQLSYAALLSIVLFMKPIYNLYCFKNKIGDVIWQLNAVTLSAQILTVPLTIFYFHQFPTSFLVTNIIAVPLSSVVLMSEIGLCALAFSDSLSHVVGILISWLIRILNGTVEWMDSFSYSTINGIDINLIQVASIYLFIFSIASWLLKRLNIFLPGAMAAVILFMAEQFI